MGVRHEDRREPRAAVTQATAPSGGSTLRLTRRGRVVLVLTALVLLSLGLSAGHATLASGPEGPSVRIHVVRPGETLWEIAQRLEPDHDPRPVVYDICRLNDGGCAGLEAGQRLVVPVG